MSAPPAPGPTAPPSAAAAYDAIAARYDALPRGNPVLAHMREESLAAILRCMPTRGIVLEVGCGTGVEACTLLRARQDLRVLATDPSMEMLRACRARARRDLVEERLSLVRLDAGALDAVAPRSLAGAWSSFALSYEPDLPRVARSLARALVPGAPLVVTLRNPYALAEPWSILPRRVGWYRHKVGASRVPLRHWSLRQAERAFAASGFDLRAARALPLLLPPPRYGGALRPIAPWLGSLRRVDRALAGRPILRAAGDHLLLELTLARPPVGSSTKASSGGA